MFNKRGMTNELFFNIFELILAAIVLLSLLTFVKGVANQSIFEKNYLARDLASTVNTIYAAPGDVDYNYYENSKGFVFFTEFAPNRIFAYEKEEKNPEQHIYYPFAEDKKIQFSYNTMNHSSQVQIKFSKNNNKITAEKPK